MKGLYKLHCDCGRQGTLTGIFIEDSAYVDALLESGIEVHFGEVLGKHSNVEGALTKDDISLISSDPLVVEIIEMHEIEHGYNPFGYTTYCVPSLIHDLMKDDWCVRDAVGEYIARRNA